MSSARPPLARFGVFGDVHTEDERIAYALKHLHALEVDAVLCVGDVVDGYGDMDRTVSLLVEAGVDVAAGNHERWFLAGEMRTLDNATHEVAEPTRLIMESWPVTRRFDSIDGGILLCHGVGEDDMAMLTTDTRGYALQGIPELRDLMLDESVRYMVGGHTHERMVRRFQGLTVINAGTVTSDDGCYLVVDLEARKATYYRALTEGEPEIIETMDVPAPADLPPM